MPEVTITLRTIDESSKATKKVKEEYASLLPGLEKATQGVGNFMSANAALIGVVAGVAAGVAAAYNEYAKYAESVRDVSLVTGQNAEETSRLLQVLDDFQLTAEDTTTAARFLKEKGLTPNIETLAQLSDQFRSIEDPAQRLAFIQENLGRGGAKWANVLNQGGDALREMSGEISEGLILSDEQIKKYEQQRLALDALSDSWQALKVSAGAALGEVISKSQIQSRTFEIFEKNTGRVAGSLDQFSQEWKDAMAQAEQELTAETEAVSASTAAMKENEEAVKAAEEARKALSDTLSGQIGLINQMQTAEDSYTEKSQSLAEQRAEAEAKVAELKRQGWWEQSQQMLDAVADVESVKAAEAALAEERAKQSLQFISSILQEQLARDGWTQAEFDAFAKQQQAWGLWSADTVAKSQAAWQEANKITEAINGIPTEKTVTISVNQVNSATQSYTAMAQAYQQRDAGGGGVTGVANVITPNAAPEVFTPSTNGSFTPNANQNLIDYNKLARVLRDAIRQGAE